MQIWARLENATSGIKRGKKLNKKNTHDPTDLPVHPDTTGGPQVKQVGPTLTHFTQLTGGFILMREL